MGMFWNIKFASVAQDVGMIWHVGQSHLWAFTFCLAFGWDYMHLRVPTLLVHFTFGLLSGPPSYFIAPGIRKIGFGYFFDLLVGPAWMWLMALSAAIPSLLCSIDTLAVLSGRPSVFV